MTAIEDLGFAAETTVSAKAAPRIKAKKQEESTQKTKVYVIDSGGGIVYRISQNEVVVYDPEKGYNRSIRYCPNERSIYVDEQSSNGVREQVVFRDGMLMAPYDQPNLSAYLDAHPGNKKNGGGVFRLLETEKNAEKEIESEFLTYDAISLVRDKSIEELIPVALSLGVSTNQKNAEIKRELLQEAKSNPQRFIEMFDSPIVKARATVLGAVEYQILLPKNDGMYWFDSNRLIVATPVGQDSTEVMTRFCLTENGSILYNQLQDELAKI